MFSWTSSKPAEAKPSKPEYPSSFDPLKGLKGAAAFYELYSWGPTVPPKGATKTGSAAAYYFGSQERPRGEADAAVSSEGEGDAVGATPSSDAPGAKCPGIDQVNDFLRAGKAQLADSGSRSVIRAVLGSAVADLDATVCSLVYAASAYQREAGGNAAGGGGVCPVPVLLTKRADFRLRSETHWLLGTMGVDLGLLTFADEVDLRRLHAEGRLQVVLAGTKNMPEQFQGLESAVLEVLPSPSLTPAADSSTGATTEDGYSSAVILAKKLSEEHPEVFINPALCRLLLASILLSTNNLEPSHSAEVDCSMAAFLIVGARMGGYIHFYEQLRLKKYSQTFLATEELLRSDFAQHEMGPGTRGKKGGEVLRVGVCNVAISLAEFVGKDPEFAEKLAAFKDSHALHALFFLATYYSTTNKRFKKEICVVSDIPGLLAGVSYFLQQGKNELKLKSILVRGLPNNAKAFQLGNSVVTRPDIEKCLLAYFDDGR